MFSLTTKGQLSSDYNLVPIATLKYKADILRAKNLEAEWNEVIYADESSQVSPSLFVHCSDTQYLSEVN